MTERVSIEYDLAPLYRLMENLLKTGVSTRDIIDGWKEYLETGAPRPEESNTGRQNLVMGDILKANTEDEILVTIRKIRRKTPEMRRAIAKYADILRKQAND